MKSFHLILSVLLACLPCTYSFSNGDEQVLDCTDHARLVVPESALSKDAVKVESGDGPKRFVDWTKEQQAETYALIQKVAAVWQKQGAGEYLVFGDEDALGGFGWQVVPFPANENAMWKRLNVLRRVCFGGINQKKRDQGQAASCYRHSEIGVPPVAFPQHQVCFGCDPFCDPEVVAAQQVIDDPEKSVRVLYDYKPLAYYHFLIVPKAHESKFSDVPLQTYVESMEYAQMLLKKYAVDGTKVYIFHKTGERAGQSVPHWHMHVVIPNSRGEELYGQSKVLAKMLWGGSALGPDELQKRVTAIRADLNP